jgi:sulfite reductase alpha subunit-like flavoprotein
MSSETPKEVRQNLIRTLDARVHDAEVRRLQAKADKNDADANHYYSARNAYIDALWLVAKAILPPDEFEAFRAEKERGR